MECHVYGHGENITSYLRKWLMVQNDNIIQIQYDKEEVYFESEGENEKEREGGEREGARKENRFGQIHRAEILSSLTDNTVRHCQRSRVQSINVIDDLYSFICCSNTFHALDVSLLLMQLLRHVNYRISRRI